MIQSDEERVEPGPESFDDLALEAIASGPPADAGEDAAPVEPILGRAERLELDVPARLRLFQSACRMVHEGHRRGRISGDLKPSRLGVNEAGEPAEIPPGDEDPAMLDACTSPEQVLGEPATTAADVYALGAILYELLTGRPPIAVDPASPDSAALAITERAPERPSRAATADRRRAIRSDLDAIVLRALFKESERRYDSAAALAEDIDAYLAGFPVRAGRTSEWGRVIRFARRRPWAPAALAAAFAAAIAWGAWEARQARSILRDRDRMALAAGSAGAAVATAVERLADAATDDDAGTLRRDILEGARSYYERVIGTPYERTDALTRIATIDRALGRKAEAAAGYRAAIDDWKRLAAHRLGDAALALRLADARVGLARALDPKAAGPDADAALESLSAAGATYLALADREPNEPAHRRRLARVFRDRAEIERRSGRGREALGSVRHAVRLLEELGWADPDKAEARIELSSTYGLLAALLMELDDGLEPAVMALDRAIGLLDGTIGPLKDSPRVGHDTAARLIDLAEIQLAHGSVVPAAASLDRAVKILEDLAAKFPAVATYRGELASAYNLDAERLRGRGKRDEAKARAEQARAMLERLAVERAGEPRYAVALATSRQILGRLLALEGKTAEALKAFQGAADALEAMKDADRTGADAYALACDLSLGLTLIGVKDGAKPIDDPEDPSLTPVDRARRDVYARRAVAALRQAVARGYDSPDLYRRDPALDPLRPREDFKKVIEEVVAKAGNQP